MRFRPLTALNNFTKIAFLYCPIIVAFGGKKSIRMPFMSQEKRWQILLISIFALWTSWVVMNSCFRCFGFLYLVCNSELRDYGENSVCHCFQTANCRYNITQFNFVQRTTHFRYVNQSVFFHNVPYFIQIYLISQILQFVLVLHQISTKT